MGETRNDQRAKLDTTKGQNKISPKGKTRLAQRAKLKTQKGKIK